jgi:hypothetical protein
VFTTTRMILCQTRSGGYISVTNHAPHLVHHPSPRPASSIVLLYISVRPLFNQYHTNSTMSEPQFFESITKVCSSLTTCHEAPKFPNAQHTANTVSRMPISRSPSKVSIPPTSARHLITWSRSLVSFFYLVADSQLINRSIWQSRIYRCPERSKREYRRKLARPLSTGIS